MSLIRGIAQDVISNLLPLEMPGIGWIDFNSPASRIISVLRDLGLGYNTQDMYDDIRKATGRVKYQSQVEDLGSNKPIPSAWMSHEQLGSPYEYRVQLIVDYYDRNTGEYYSEYRYMFSDKYSKKADWAEDYYAYADSFKYEPGVEIMNTKVIGAAKNTWTY